MSDSIPPEPEWLGEARALGFVTKHGIVPNASMVEGVNLETGAVTVRLMTPLRAAVYAEDLERKRPPYRFDRTPDGQGAILRGRWFIAALEALRDKPTNPPEWRSFAAVALSGELSDSVLPIEHVIMDKILLVRTGETVDCEYVFPPHTIIIRCPGLAGWPNPPAELEEGDDE